MSLLNRGTEVVKVFQETQTPDIDADGNTRTRASQVAYVARAVLQPISSTESTDGGGFDTAARYRMRLVNYPVVLGAQSQIEWRGQRWSVVGDGLVFNSSPRTARVEYIIERR